MNKAILLSIKPKWVAKILNGEKTIEVRKRFPKDYRGWVYIYCTKEKPRAILTDKGCVVANTLAVGGNSQYKSGYSLSGEIVARFWCDNVEEIEEDYTQGETMYDWYEGLRTETIDQFELLKLSCLAEDELNKYLDYWSKKTYYGYAIHISKLEIFDEPKELSDFMPVKWNKCGVKDKNGLYQCHKCPYGEVLSYGGECHYKPLKRPPQSYCFVESEDQK